MAESTCVTLIFKLTTLLPLVARKLYSPALSNVTVVFKPEAAKVAEPSLGADTCCQVAVAELVSVSCLAEVLVVLFEASLLEPEVIFSVSRTVTR